MDAFLEALRSRVAAGRPRAERAPLAVDLARAPESVRALASAMVERDFYVELGAFSMYAGDGDRVSSLAEVLERSLAEVQEADGVPPEEILGGLRPGDTLVLGADPGGMRVFGLAWPAGKILVVVVEIEDPTPVNVLRRFDTPGAFLDLVAGQLGDGDGDDARATLAALRGAVPPTAPAATAPPPAALAQADQGAPANPWAQAHKLLGKKGVTSCDATPAGRRVLVRGSGSATALRVEVLDPDGTRRPVALSAQDVYGAAVHPTAERALLGLGAPGPLVELDLGSLAVTELHPRAGWRAGYPDAAHLAVLTEGRLELHRAGTTPLGPPLQSIACGGNNLLVAPGRCFVVHQGEVGCFTLGPDGLVDRGKLPVTGRPIFYLSAFATKAGASFLGSCGWDGAWTWYRLPA